LYVPKQSEHSESNVIRNKRDNQFLLEEFPITLPSYEGIVLVNESGGSGWSGISLPPARWIGFSSRPSDSACLDIGREAKGIEISSVDFIWISSGTGFFGSLPLKN
jgi:hypothetical protein